MAWRSRIFPLRLAALAIVLVSWSPGAGAIPITRTFEFKAVDLESQIFDQGVFPVTDPVFGRFTVVFDPGDPAVMEAEVLAGSINIATTSSTVGYSYRPDLDLLTFGDVAGGIEGGSIADFILRVGDASTLIPRFLHFSYNERREYWIAADGSVSLVGVTAPAGSGLFAVGIGGLLLLSLHARQAVAGRPASASRRSVPGGSCSGPARWSRGRGRPGRRTG